METPSICEHQRSTSAIVLLAVLAMTSTGVESHGRLLQPPSRSSMWRFGFRTPPNYNDHELFCGGLSRLQYNRGRCGICGDPYDMPQPRPNEAGGLYGNGIIVQRYKANQIIQTEIELTANHRGYFEFKLCPVNNPRINPSQNCFDRNVLRLADRKGTRFYVIKRSPNQRYRVRLVLPKGLRCTFCTLQWNYVAGNNWGQCNNGHVGMGCGPQETFRACSDVSIGGRFYKRGVTGDDLKNVTFEEDLSVTENENDFVNSSISSACASTIITIGLALALTLQFVLVKYF